MSHDYNYTFVIPTILYPQKTEINRLHLNVFPTTKVLPEIMRTHIVELRKTTKSVLPGFKLSRESRLVPQLVLQLHQHFLFLSYMK